MMKPLHLLAAMVGALLLIPKRMVAAYIPALAASSSTVSSSDTSGAMKVSYLNKSGVTRGVKNNNPLNIRVSKDAWKGKISLSSNTDKNKEFEQFEYWVYGLRAAIKLLKAYYDKHGLHTIKGIINRWAPPNENKTDVYVSSVSTWSGIPSEDVISWNKETIRKLVKSMAKMEIGGNYITDAHFDAAWSLV